MMDPLLRAALLSILLAALLVPAVAAGSGGEARTKVLLGDFASEERRASTLIRTFRAHEERRMAAEVRLQGEKPDESRAAALLEAAGRLEVGRD